MNKKALSLMTFIGLFLLPSVQAIDVDDVERELRFIESMKEAQEKEFRFLQQRNKQLRQERMELMGVSSNLERVPAAQSLETNLKSLLAQHLKETFQDKGQKINIDVETGSVNLSMKDFHLFANNASELDERAKGKLAQLLPHYFEALNNFSHFEKIKSVNIIGHASPVFNQKYVDPKGSSAVEQKAYLFNLDISAFRAREIVKFVFDQRFNSIENISHFRSRLQAVGKSFNNPVKRAPSSAPTLCGPFDCDLSRRVELAVEFH